MINELVEKGLENSITYREFRALVADLLEKDQSTSGSGEAMLNYSKLSNSRMKRLDKTIKLDKTVLNKINDIKEPTTWLVLMEGWCGDGAQTLPVMNKFAEVNSNINLRIVLRDENKELMSHFLTNGGEAIPKLIQLKNGEITGDWGPRPSEATKMVNTYKEEYGKLTPEFKKDLQVWYNKDKGQNMTQDLLSLLNLELA